MIDTHCDNETDRNQNHILLPLNWYWLDNKGRGYGHATLLCLDVVNRRPCHGATHDALPSMHMQGG